MTLVSLALAAVLIAPTPDPVVSALQISPVSTCDDMVIGVYNPTDKQIEMTPMANDQTLPTLVVPAQQSAATDVPARDGLYVSLMTDNKVSLGPWVWKAPPDCSEVPTDAFAAPPSRAQATMTFLGQVQAGLTWFFLGGMAMLLLALGGLLKSKLLDGKNANHRLGGRHRIAPDSLARYIAGGWFLPSR
jgi:hypothetical protein